MDAGAFARMMDAFVGLGVIALCMDFAHCCKGCRRIMDGGDTTSFCWGESQMELSQFGKGHAVNRAHGKHQKSRI